MKKLTFLLFISLITTQIFAQNRLTPELLWSLGRVSLQDVSPDGQTVLYSVTYSNIKENNSKRDLYSIDVSGDAKSLKKLTATPENEGNAQYRPDGKKIGYLKSGYIWEMNLDGSNPKKISDFAVNGFKYSPDGFHILYINDVKYKQTTKEIYPDLPMANARIIDDLMYRHWDHYEDESYSNIFIAKYIDGKIAGEGPNIMREPFDSPLSPFGGLEQINWTPDGKGIVYVCKKLAGRDYAVSTNSDIYLYTLKGGATRNLTKANKGYDLDPVFSADGKLMAYNSMEKDGYESDKYRLMVMNMENFQVQDATKGFDANAHSPQFAPDGKAIYFTSETQGTQHIFQFNIDNSKIRQFTQGTYNYYDFVATKEALIARRCSMSEPHEIFRVAYDKAKPVPITQINAATLSKVNMGACNRAQSKRQTERTC